MHLFVENTPGLATAYTVNDLYGVWISQKYCHLSEQHFSCSRLPFSPFCWNQPFIKQMD